MFGCICERIKIWLWVCWNYIMIYVIGAWYVIKELIQTHNTPTGLVNGEDRVAIVTGGGRGIGLETVKCFLKHNMTVIIGGQDVSEMENTMAKIRTEITEGKVICVELDLSNMSSVRSFVKRFEELKLPLHILVNNAGIMFSPLARTVDGYESHWSINYLGHFLLTHLLIPHLSQPARIVNVSSSVHYIGSINFDDINSKKRYSGEAAYAQSKLALMMFTISLAERYKNDGIIVNAVHPGVVATQLYKHVSWANAFPWLKQALLKTPKQGSDTLIHCALSQHIKEGGHYYENCIRTSPASAATRTIDQHRLWDLSCSQLGIKSFGQP